MTERKQLELAAKACGLTEFRWNKNKECMCHYNEQMKTWYQQGYGDMIEWRPDIDQLDSDRMGAKLHISLHWYQYGVEVFTDAMAHYEPFLDHNNDENAALMAARMRCAVAIGDGME